MTPVSVVMIVKDEEANLPRAVASAAWGDEILVVDTGSRDNTLLLAESLNCRTAVIEWKGFGQAKQTVVEMAAHDWIFSLDADEEVSPALRDRLTGILMHEPEYTAYEFKRVSTYLGRQIRYSGWNRDYALRLFNRKQCRFSDRLVHEKVIAAGKTARIEDPLYHYPYADLAEHWSKINQYTSLGARQLIEDGRRHGLGAGLFRGTHAALKKYILRAGFRDGPQGVVLAVLTGIGVFLKYAKAWDMERGRSDQ